MSTCTCACIHAHVHLHACACVHVCAHVMTHALHQSLGHKCRTHSPGPRSHPHSGPGGSQAQPREPCPEVCGRLAGESGGSEARRAAPPPRHSAPPGYPLRGPCLDGSTASGQPPAPSLPLIAWPPPSPERTPHSSSTPRLLPLGSQHVTHPLSQPLRHLRSVSWGVIWLLPCVCDRPSPAMGTPGSSTGPVTLKRQMWEQTQRAGLGAPGTHSWKKVRMGRERAAKWKGWDRHGVTIERGQAGPHGGLEAGRHPGTPEARGGRGKVGVCPGHPAGQRIRGLFSSSRPGCL